MLDPLLTIEQDNSLWDVEANGLHLWPLIRFSVLLEKLNTELGIDDGNRTTRRMLIHPQKWPRYFHTLPLLLSRPRTNRSVLFWVKDTTRFPNIDGLTSFDRVHEEFYRKFQNPLILEGSPTSWNPPPDSNFENDIFSQDLFWLMAFANTLRRRLSLPIRNHIDEFSEMVTTLYAMPKAKKRLTKRMETLLKLYFEIEPLLERYVVPRLGRKFAIVTCASLMGFEGLIVRPLHNLGFQVAEAQHGIIHKRHYAYQYPPECFSKNHPCHSYLPDTLLTYGSYWSEIVHTPSRITAIGYPYLSKTIDENTREAITKPHQVLVVASIGRVEDTIQLPEALATALPNYQIILKLHPSKLHLLNEYLERNKHHNLNIVGQADTYHLIAESEVVICAQPSTVLIEAAAFPGKRVFFGSRDLLPEGIGEYFETAEQLIDMIKDCSRGLPQRQSEEFWDSNWQTHLDRYVLSTTTE